MRIRPLIIFVSLLLVASVGHSAAKSGKKVTKLPAKKVVVKADSKEIDLDAEIEKELEENIQSEPTTRVEASPLVTSESTAMRDKRRQMEMDTEEQMVQELESSRIQDEKTRRERVFGDRIQPVSQPIPVVQQTSPAPVVNITNEIKTDAVVEEESTESTANYYIGLTGGFVDSRANNVDGTGAGGFSLGAIMPLHTSPGFSGSLGLEGSFLYTLLEGSTRSTFGTSDYDVDQYHASAAARYYLESGWFVPGAGVVMSYTRRQYKVTGDDNFSNALDMGLGLSGDLRLNKTVTVGLEYRYMMNLDYERDKAPSQVAVAAQKAVTSSEVKNLEAIDYQMILLNGKISF